MRFNVSHVSSGDLQGPVFRKPISANPGLNFNLDFYTSLFDSLFGIIFSTLYGASNHQIVDKKNSTEFSIKASRAEIRFHTNPGLSKPSFEKPSPGDLHAVMPQRHHVDAKVLYSQGMLVVLQKI